MNSKAKRDQLKQGHTNGHGVGSSAFSFSIIEQQVAFVAVAAIIGGDTHSQLHSSLSKKEEHLATV